MYVCPCVCVSMCVHVWKKKCGWNHKTPDSQISKGGQIRLDISPNCGRK